MALNRTHEGERIGEPVVVDERMGERMSAIADFAPPRSAYVHVPFCRHRCGYCNFSVLTGRDDLFSDYLQALQRELSCLEHPRPVETLYIGGGTPTHFDLPVLARFLKLVDHWFPPASPAAPSADNPAQSERSARPQTGERSVEANPNDITIDKLKLFADHGINRISLGVQSFNADKLRVLERTHRPEQAERAIELAAQWIGNVSIDLIFATPGETPARWLDDLRRATRLPIDHVSTYGLTLEKGTLFWNRARRNEVTEVGEADQWQMYRDAIAHLSAHGWSHYEVSNFAKPGKRCVHNLCYWQGTPWYGAGPGAARFVDARREVNHRSATTYIKHVLAGKSPVAESETLTHEQLIRERVAFGLRMIDGFDLAQAGAIADVNALLASTLHQLVTLKMIQRNGDHIQLTDAGLMVSDSVLSEILG